MRLPRSVFVVSHTHWDREWYLTYHTFRVRLVDIVRRVLDALEEDPAFEHFLLDGQAVLLEDYLEVHPEDEDRIRRLVEKNALSLGPCYVLPDEFLVSAEAHVRNLVYGHQAGRRCGGVQKVGYMPDSFGHIAQLPQILCGAGIDSFVYTRGNGDEIERTGHEFFWVAPDGSEVLAINQCAGYCNAAGLGYEEIWHAHTQREVRLERAREQVAELFEKMAPLSRGDIALLCNGCDHFPPQPELGSVLDALREEFPRTEFRHASLSEYIAAVRDAGFARERYAGELRHGKLHPILSGVWSARMPLKQQNDAAQTILADTWEPLAAYARFLHGRPYPTGLFAYAWKLLLKSHPHDSICGCSIDEVHRDMGPRFDGVLQTAAQALRDELTQFAPTFARRKEDDRHTVLCVANPLPFARQEVLDRWVVLQPFGIDPADLALVDEQGRPVPFEILETHYLERFWGVDYRTMLDPREQEALLRGYLDAFGPRIQKAPGEGADCFLKLRLLADLPPLGHVNYRLTEGGARALQPAGVRVTGTTLENAHLRVDVHADGTFDVCDKESGRTHRGLNRIEDTEDIGDEYDYAPCERTETITTGDIEGEVRVVDRGASALRAAVEVSLTLDLPEAIAPDRRARAEKRVACPVTIRVGLAHDARVVDVETAFDNRARDHRLRAVFPVACRSVVSDGHFYLNERPVGQPSGEGWVQPPPTTYPQQDFSLADGLALFNRGLPEIEARKGSLHLTLLRCVGWLSRDDFATRRFSNAGPTVATPDAQCIGVHRFHYAVAPYAGDWVASGIKALGRRYRVAPLVVQGVEDRAVPGASLFGHVSEHASVTAIKRHEERDTLIVRLFNLTGTAIEETLSLGRDVEAAWSVNLLEEREAELAPASLRELRVGLRPFGISTVEVKFTPSPPQVGDAAR
jgi:alpha-mannosidase